MQAGIFAMAGANWNPPKPARFISFHPSSNPGPSISLCRYARYSDDLGQLIDCATRLTSIL